MASAIEKCVNEYYPGVEVKIEHAEGLADCKKILSMAKIGRMNGCLIEGTVENCVIGRGCTIKEGAVIKNCVIGADVVIGKGVHAENLVIDKHARLIRGKRIIASPDKPGYIKRGDRL